MEKISVRDYALKHNRSVSGVYNQIKSGKLDTENINGQIYIIDDSPRVPTSNNHNDKKLKRKIKRLKKKLYECQKVTNRQADYIFSLSSQISEITRLSLSKPITDTPDTTETIDVKPIKKKGRKKSKKKKSKKK